MRSKFILVLLIFFGQAGLFAEEHYNFFQFSCDSVCYIKQPSRWEGLDWQKFAFIGAGAAVLSQFDEKVQDYFQAHPGHDHNALIVGGRMWGDYYPTLIIFSAFGLHGWAYGDNLSKRITIEIFQTTLYSEALTEVLKGAVGRARPYTGRGPFTFRPGSFFKSSYNSFPSGHSTAAFAVSSVISKNVSSDYLKALVYVPAVCTMVSRSYQDKHWASDNFVGAAIGYSVGTWLVDTDRLSNMGIKLSSIYPPTIQMSF